MTKETQRLIHTHISIVKEVFSRDLMLRGVSQDYDICHAFLFMDNH